MWTLTSLIFKVVDLYELRAFIGYVFHPLSSVLKLLEHAISDHFLELLRSLIVFFCLGGYITVWDVGNFLLDPPSENNDGEHQDDEQESNKEESKKEPKVNCLAHFYDVSLRS